ncbi:hypothetical protein Q31a_12030 [Aureliella helgolandensis]|uniref:Uncharacterized protein n=2 Tax=Aureliella helgolandensis TaxID=2527968 RepID=A0A518G2W7_9BACT|nr:hypothetical protein Q31a_12030 [Aureliella helgolandensis]
MGLGCLNPGKCNCEPRVLLWDVGRESPSLTSLEACQDVYDGLGIASDLASADEYSGSLSNYKLILAVWTAEDPPWLGQLTSWTGRLLLAGDYYRAPPDPPPRGNPLSNAWINALCTTKGVDIQIDSDVINRSVYARTVSNDLTSSTASLSGGVHSTITVGPSATQLYHSVGTFGAPPYIPCVARHRVGDIDYVVNGDGTMFVTAGAVASKSAWLEQLFTAS